MFRNWVDQKIKTLEKELDAMMIDLELTEETKRENLEYMHTLGEYRAYVDMVKVWDGLNKSPDRTGEDLRRFNEIRDQLD